MCNEGTTTFHSGGEARYGPLCVMLYFEKDKAQKQWLSLCFSDPFPLSVGFVFVSFVTKWYRAKGRKVTSSSMCFDGYIGVQKKAAMGDLLQRVIGFGEKIRIPALKRDGSVVGVPRRR